MRDAATAEARALVPVVDAEVLVPPADTEDPEWSEVYLWLRNVSPRAREAYLCDLGQFTTWARERGVTQFKRVTRRMMLDWRDDLEARGLSPATVARKLSCLRRCFTELQNDAEKTGVRGNPVAGVRGQEKVSATSPRHALKNPQALALLGAPNRATVKGARDYAILSLLLYLGLRRSEVAGLTTAAIEDAGVGGGIVRFRGKGSHVRELPVPPHVMEALRVYLEMDGHRAHPLGESANGQTAQPLFRPLRNSQPGGTLNQAITPRAI